MVSNFFKLINPVIISLLFLMNGCIGKVNNCFLGVKIHLTGPGFQSAMSRARGQEREADGQRQAKRIVRQLRVRKGRRREWLI